MAAPIQVPVAAHRAQAGWPEVPGKVKGCQSLSFSGTRRASSFDNSQTEPSLCLSFGQWSPTPVLSSATHTEADPQTPLHSPHPFTGSPSPLPRLAPPLVDFAQHLKQLQPLLGLSSVFSHRSSELANLKLHLRMFQHLPVALSFLLPQPCSATGHFCLLLG